VTMLDRAAEPVADDVAVAQIAERPPAIYYDGDVEPALIPGCGEIGARWRTTAGVGRRRDRGEGIEVVGRLRAPIGLRASQLSGWMTR
jgi:hypothetical protein